MSEQIETTETMRPPLISGWCGHGSSKESHKRCSGGQRANPERIYQPCPCVHHLDEERYDCEECGGTLALHPILTEMTGDEVYVHLNEETGRWTGEYCA